MQKSNPKVQVHAAKSGFLQLTLNKLDLVLGVDEADKDFVSRSLFALSGLLRNFPHAQGQFVRFGGVETMRTLLENQAISVKLKVKALTILNDLLLEKRSVLTNTDKSDEHKSKLKQYQE
jgi:hypothetical protein